MRPWVWLVGGFAAVAIGPSTGRAAAVLCHSSFFVDAQTAVPSSIADVNFQTFADVDGDGVIDRILVTSNLLQVEYRAADGSVRSTASFAAPDNFTSFVSAVAGDIDGKPGAEIAIPAGSQIIIVRAGTGGALSQLQAVTNAPNVVGPIVAVGHFRARSQMDLVVETAVDTLTLEKLSGTTFTAGPSIAIGTDMGNSGEFQLMVIAADVDGDGLDDLIYPSVDGVGVARLGAGSAWQSIADLMVTGGYSTVVAGDFDGNGKTDVAALLMAAQNAFTPPLRAWMQSTAGAFSTIPDVNLEFQGSQLFAGDLSGDGVPEIVGFRQVAQYAAGAWQLSEIPRSFNAVFGLLDWNGDGLLDLFGETYPNSGITPGGWADIAIAPMNLPPTVPAGQPASLTFSVTNNGPSPATGLALTASIVGAGISVPGCTSTDCSGLTLAPGQTVPVTVTVQVPGDQFNLTVSACSTLYDRVSANDSATISLPIAPRADLGALANFDTKNGSFTMQATAGNQGPSPATNVTLTIDIPPGASGTTWTSTPTGTCSLAGNTLSCTLASLPAMQNWVVTLMGAFAYHGQSLTESATASSDVVDPNPGNNTFSLTLPALTAGAGTVASVASGCGCGVARGGPAIDLAWLVGLALLLSRRRSRKISARPEGECATAAGLIESVRAHSR